MKNVRRFSAACFMVLALLVSGARQLQDDPILQVIDIRPIIARHDIGNAHGLAYNPDSNVIYLAHGSDYTGAFIYTLDAEGNLLSELDFQSVYQPEAFVNSLNYDRSSGHLFVEAIVPVGTGFETHLVEMDPSSGAILSDLPIANLGSGLHVRDDGIWQAQFAEDTIRHYTREGVFIEDISVADSFPGFPGPTALTSSFTGGLFIVDHFGYRIVEVDLAGHEIAVASTENLGDGRPLAIAVDLDTQRIFLQVNNQYIYVLSSAFLEQDVRVVLINVRPIHASNHINPAINDPLPVAILTTGSFDATTVDPTTVRFGAEGTGAAPVHSTFKDVDADGDVDMLLFFRPSETGLQCGDNSASLTGVTLSGQPIEGSDFITTVGCDFGDKNTDSN